MILEGVRVERTRALSSGDSGLGTITNGALSVTSTDLSADGQIARHTTEGTGCFIFLRVLSLTA